MGEVWNPPKFTKIIPFIDSSTIHILPHQLTRVRPTAEVGESTNNPKKEVKNKNKKEVKMTTKKLRFAPSIGPLAVVQTTRLGVTSHHFEL